jgi:ribulose-phosphate 3-epimerase
MSLILSASILSADFGHLADQIKEAESYGVDWIHIDVMDGHFVPDITMGPFVVKTCRNITGLPLDVHLMVEKPERHLPAFAQAGASNITVHLETCPHIFHTLQVIRSLGCHPGIAINPGTPADLISSVIHLADLVLVMTVNPGASGQEFLNEIVSKIEIVDQMIKRKNISTMIEVDGGITAATLPLTYEAGARAIVSASSIFRDPDGIKHGIQLLRSSILK